MKSNRNLKKKLKLLEFNHFKEKLFKDNLFLSLNIFKTKIDYFFIIIIIIYDYFRRFYKSYDK